MPYQRGDEDPIDLESCMWIGGFGLLEVGDTRITWSSDLTFWSQRSNVATHEVAQRRIWVSNNHVEDTKETKIQDCQDIVTRDRICRRYPLNPFMRKDHQIPRTHLRVGITDLVPGDNIDRLASEIGIIGQLHSMMSTQCSRCGKMLFKRKIKRRYTRSCGWN